MSLSQLIETVRAKLGEGRGRKPLPYAELPTEIAKVLRKICPGFSGERLLSPAVYHRAVSQSLPADSKSITANRKLLARAFSEILGYQVDENFKVISLDTKEKSFSIKKTHLQALLQEEDPQLWMIVSLQEYEKKINSILGLSLSVEQCKGLISIEKTKLEQGRP